MSRQLKHVCMLIMLMILSVAATGCGTLGIGSAGTGGAIEVISQGKEPLRIEATLPYGVYSNSLTTDQTIYLADQPLRQVSTGRARPSQLVKIELLWTPVPDRTPMDPAATNASIWYIIMSGEEIGVYKGGGFVRVSGESGEDLSIKILDATLRFDTGTAGFNDLLETVTLTGSFGVPFNENQTRQTHFRLSQYLTDIFDRTYLVLGR